MKPRQPAPGALKKGSVPEGQPAKEHRYFSRRSILLTAAAICFIIAFSQAGQYKAWTQKLVIFWNVFLKQKDNLSEKDRMASYYGDAYNYKELMYIKKNLEKSGYPNPVILFPPAGYFTSHKIDFSPPEPAAFYFHTGYVCLPFNAPDAQRATHFVEIDKYQMKMSRIKSPEQFNQIRQRYQNYQ